MALYDAAPPRCFEYDTARSIPNSQRANSQVVQMPTPNRQRPTRSTPNRGLRRWRPRSFPGLPGGSWPLGIVCALLVSISAAAASGRDSITDASVRAHLEFLASDALNGRGSGTRDELLAADYIGSQRR